MKDITLKIVGKHIYENVEEDQLELVTEGKLYKKDGRIYSRRGRGAHDEERERCRHRHGDMF